ncbi:hypothetical protein KBY88_13435 [Cyanobium sp. Morenito 9A2]|nr:hypothetical protein [Cyanobium sp. Morenito 9A2]
MQLSTSEACALVIGAYPPFRYDARGGRGRGLLGPSAAAGPQALVFDPASLSIPALSWRTARFLGLPLPPGLSIVIDAKRLEGSLDAATGELALRFQARFHFAIGSLYRAPPLLVDTELRTGTVRGRRHTTCGAPLAADGSARLVGVATIPPSGEAWFDRFLGLPDEALAMLRCHFSATDP